MKGRAISWSDAELAWIKAHHRADRRETFRLFVETFRRSDVSLSNFNALCKRNGWLTGRSGRFEKGQTPVNKGKKMPWNPRSAATRFKKGQRPHNTRELWAERVSTDGYVEISVPETNPHTGFERRFVLKHRWLWEQKHGPVPEGHALKCIDGNKLNTEPSNWTPVPRALLPRLNGRHGRNYDAAPAPLKPAIMATARLEHAVRTIGKAEE